MLTHKSKIVRVVLALSLAVAAVGLMTRSSWSTSPNGEKTNSGTGASFAARVPAMAAVGTLAAPAPPCATTSGLIISEFRLRGLAGITDEFIELYNNTDLPITVCTIDGSTGWAVATSDGITRAVVPVDTVIPARAHYLITGSGYSLSGYAASDLSYSMDIPDNLGLAVFNTSSAVSFATATRLDAVGFTTTTNTLYREGNGLAPISATNGQYSFIRKLFTGVPQDTADNASDFVFIAADGGNYGVVAQLGAPSPENLASPLQHNSQVAVAVIDPAVGANVAPNRVRDTTAIGPNAAAGTLTIRRKLTNMSSGAITRLRARVVDITTLNTPGYVPGGSQADMRALSSSDLTVALTGGSQVLVRGTTVETPPLQPMGGGLNASLGVMAFTLAQPLAPGASTNVQFVLGVQQTGTFRFLLNIEALTNNAPSSLPGGPYSGPTGSPIQFNGSNSFDLEGAVSNYQWNFGDGNSATGSTPAHVYTSTGTYTVSLTVTDSGGLTTTGTTTATIYPASNQMPVVVLNGPYTAIAGQSTTFSGSSCYDPDGTITSHKWDFGGAGSATGVNASFTFPSTGNYLVALTVKDNLGATSWKSINVIVSGSGGGGGQQLQTFSESDWDPTTRPSLDDPRNNRGRSANETTGNNNFQLTAPVVSLPGRGINLSMNLVYNSLVWNKAGSDMYFDIDRDWPAPGWHFGFGKMVNMGQGGALIIEPDGTRHSFTGKVEIVNFPAFGAFPAVNKPVFTGTTTDGSMIEYRCEQQVNGTGLARGMARYPNGTTVFYGNFNGIFPQFKNYLYPTVIVDANGNRTTIEYHWDTEEARIKRLVDSVGRIIDFNYDTQKRLTSVTGPALGSGIGTLPTHTYIRLHYASRTISPSFNLNTHIRHSTVNVIDAIFYPATKTGYWFPTDAYSNFGMIKKVSQRRDMTFIPGANANEQGTITEGTVSREQTYDYDSTTGSLLEAPTFSNVSETWTGGTAAAVTNFVSQIANQERTTTVTNPNGTKTVQISHWLNNPPDSDPNKFKDGLVKEERKLDSAGNVIVKTVFTWEQGPDKAPRLTRTATTDERNQTLATDYDQFGPNNSVGRVRERDYNNVVLRTTINEYLSYTDNDVNLILDPNHGGFANRIRPRRINLIKSVKVFEGEDLTKLAAFTVNVYDDYPQPLQSYAADPLYATDVIFGSPRLPTGIVQHSTIWNPSVVSDSITRRGNVTSVTRYADTSNAASPASPIVQTIKYDMTGNVISASTLCCEATTTTFEFGTQYAFPSTQTRGSSDPNSLLRVTTSTTVDWATGLLRFITDANNRTTETTYFPDSLRIKELISPTGARMKYEYFDNDMKTIETGRLSDNGTITSQRTKYFNGLGLIIKEEALGASGAIDVVETVYDNFGRPTKQSLAYRTGQTIHWRENVYDAAGRLAQQREPALPLFFKDGPEYPKTQYFYNEATRPSGASTEPGQTTRTVDAWDRWSWARLDAAGRLVEVIEPAPGGGTGLQTKYTYNALNKLVKTEQNSQVRRFRYDSLGRVTHQKLAEAEATLNLAGQWTTAGTAADRWSDVFTYDERSNLVSRVDARGVKTTYKYKDTNNVDDPLNRLQSVSYDVSGVPVGLTVLPAATINYQYRPKTSITESIDVTQLHQINTTGVSTEVFVYDTEGRVQEKQFTFAGRPHAMKTTYSYDAAGRINQVTYPEQYRDNIVNPIRKVVVPGYDSASRISGIKVNAVDYASQVTYNAASRITSALIGTGPNQITETYTYNPLTELLSGQTVKRGATALLDFSYGYKLGYCDNPMAMCSADPIFEFHTGQLTLVVNNGPSGEWSKQYYQYDELSRLKSAHQYKWITDPKPPTGDGQWHQKTYWLQNYSYDRFGNRTAVAASNNTGQPVAQDGHPSLAYDQNTNRITTAGFTYDFAGNQLQNNTGQSFVYDAAGRLVTVKNGATTIATYTYGSSNRRLITQTGTESSTDKTYFIWDGDTVIVEYTEQTSATMPKWSKNYIYLGKRLLATEAPNSTGGEIVHYHHPDRLSSALVTNNIDTTSFTQTNLPFGTALDPGTPEVTKRRFTSYDRSATTGLDYAINRHYDPRQGRFTQPDPIGMAAVNLADPQSLNMYSYVGNDPVNRVDPDGQFWGALFRFIAGLFTSLRPNMITGSFTFGNTPPISVAFTPNLQNIAVGFGVFGFALRSEGYWLPNILGNESELNQNQASPDTPFDIIGITSQVDAILSKLACVVFAKRILTAVSTRDNPALAGGDIREIFDYFLLQRNGGFTRRMPDGSAGYGSPTGLINRETGTIFSRAWGYMSPAQQTTYDAGTTVAELFHMAGRRRFYTDRQLAEAVYNIPEYRRLARFLTPHVFESGYEDPKGAKENPNHGGWSSYFHNVQRQVCGP